MNDSATTPASAPTSSASVPCLAAETMLRVHDQLRRGAAPSFEAMLAFGEPTPR